MALIVSRASRNDLTLAPIANPTAALSAALQDFELVLSEEQKLVFRGSYTKPQAGDVIAFVSRIDAGSKDRARKCVAPRLCTFLESVVQFTGVVDTFVQSNPAIAALCWGSVKATILAASNITSYFEKVTSMIMHIGRTAPTFRQFGQLYPDSDELQAALCNYYATMVRLCIKIIQSSHRSNIAQLFSPIVNPFETEFRVLLDEITQASKVVDIQVSLASRKAAVEEMKCAELERKSNFTHRRVMQLFHNEIKQELEDLRRKKALRDRAKLQLGINEDLSTFDCMASWRQIKAKLLPGTAEWFDQDTNYHQWQSSSSPSILACYGKLGSGKSVLLSNIVAHLQSNRTRKTIVSHLFCRFDDVETLDARNIIGCICRQLLQPHLARMSHEDLRVFQHEIQNVGAYALVERVVLRLDEDLAYFVVIDGLDELELSQLLLLGQCISLLARGSHSTTFKILISSRTGLERSYTTNMHPDHTLQLNGESVDEDIERFVKITLDQSLEEGRLNLADPTLIIKIAEELCHGANGMFLWARLLIDEICEQSCDKDILKALASLPKALSELFDRKIARIRAHTTSDIIIKVLQFSGVARRPLKLAELSEIVKVKIGQRELSSADLINDMQGIVDACRGLLEIDEESFAVHFVHFSVKQHLFSSLGNNKDFDVSLQDQTFGYLCLTYLNFINFESQVEKVAASNSPAKFTALEIGLSASNLSKPTAQIARWLLKGVSKDKSIDMEEVLRCLKQDAKESQQQSGAGNFNFLSYAQTNWIYHLKQQLDTENLQLFNGFIKCVNGSNKLANRPWPAASDLPTLMKASHDLIYLQKGMLPVFEWIAVNEVSSLLCDNLQYRVQLQDLSIDDIIRIFTSLGVSGKQIMFQTMLSKLAGRLLDVAVYVKFLGAMLKMAMQLPNAFGIQILRSILDLYPTNLMWAPCCVVLQHVIINRQIEAAVFLFEAANKDLLELLVSQDFFLRQAITANDQYMLLRVAASHPDLNRPLRLGLFDVIAYYAPEFDLYPLQEFFPRQHARSIAFACISKLQSFLEIAREADTLIWNLIDDETDQIWLPQLSDGRLLGLMKSGTQVSIKLGMKFFASAPSLPLVIATEHHALDTAQVLLQLGSRMVAKARTAAGTLVDIRHRTNSSALEAAVATGWCKLVRRTKLSPKDEDPMVLASAFDIAIVTHNAEMVVLLTKHSSACFRETSDVSFLKMAYQTLLEAVEADSQPLVVALLDSFDFWHESLSLVEGAAIRSKADFAVSDIPAMRRAVLLAISPNDINNRAWYFRQIMLAQTSGEIYELPA